MANLVNERITTDDWKAIPASVKNLLLTLEHERNALQERLELRQVSSSAEYKRQLQRYQQLIEHQFRKGSSPEQHQEIEILGEQIDKVSSTFYPSLSSLMETISDHNRKQSS